MKDSIREITQISELTLGLDLGDKFSYYCIIDKSEKRVEEGKVKTQRRAMERFFKSQSKMRVVVETGTHSRWVQAIAKEQGHEEIVVNPRQVRLISQNRKKSDRKDRELLGRLARVDPELLYPIQHRSEAAQADLAVVKARDELVRARTRLVNHVRGSVKAFGERLPSCSTEAFPRRVKLHIPGCQKTALELLLEMIQQLTAQILQYDRKIQQLCQQKYPDTENIQQVRGVGPITALSFVLTLEDGGRFRRSRQVGAYLGLTPRQDQSGERDPQLRITKAGDRFVRKLMVSSAQYILEPFGSDCDLRRYGERIASRGGKSAKKRAVVAVARKLSVLLHHLWVTGEQYEPLYNSQESLPGAA
jgi:transposase